MSKFDLKKLGHFVKVSESESLSDAARKLGISQSSLTQSIRVLERGLGFELFDRQNGFALTSLGRDLIPRAKRLLNLAHDLECETESLGKGESGLLKVLCGTTMAETLIPPALVKVARDRPGLRIDLVVSDYESVPTLLIDREIDLAVAEHTNFAQDPRLNIVPLPPQEITFVCRPGHPLTKKRRKAIPLDEVFRFPLVSGFLPDWAIVWLRENHPAGQAKEAITITCNYFPIVRKVVAESDAVTGIPEPVVRRDLASGTLVRINLDTPKLFNRAGVISLRERRLGPAADYFIGLLQAEDDGQTQKTKAQ